MRIRITLMRIRIWIQLFILMQIRVQIFTLNADPDTAPRQSDGNLRPLVYRPSSAPFLNIQASICERPRILFETLKLLKFDINADPDPAFQK